MKLLRLIFAFTAVYTPLFSTIDDSVLPLMNKLLDQHFDRGEKERDRAKIELADQQRMNILRVMTYNMLYNIDEAEEKLPTHHRWQYRLPRVIEYLRYAEPDIIGSQELQEDQLQEVIDFLGANYEHYGEKTRENEGRSDVNAIFFKKSRLDLLEAKTIPFEDKECQNGFTFCLFRDKIRKNEFVVVNTKLTWGSGERRLAEAEQLNRFSNELPDTQPLLVLGDFNTYPSGNLLYYYSTYIKPLFSRSAHKFSFNGKEVEKALKGSNLKDARELSSSGHLGPLCSITNSRITVEPFVGPKLIGFILDHIFINEHVEVLTHGIDTAKVNGEYPSDHFPVVADIIMKK